MVDVFVLFLPRDLIGSNAQQAQKHLLPPWSNKYGGEVDGIGSRTVWCGGAYAGEIPTGLH
jgi:hypothetical protein